VLLLTEEAEDFFARLGFDRIERDRLPSWVADRSTACSASAVVMRRDARPTAQ
jgi:N-acetylglutamate synthase-like GNAT family acetyltransferase